jgi:hypothetical protein
MFTEEERIERQFVAVFLVFGIREKEVVLIWPEGKS